MISINERISNKIPGKTSLFIKFNYKPEIVDIIKTCHVANYDKKNLEWEVPITSLAYLLDKLSGLDDISLSFMEDRITNTQPKIYDLHETKTTLFKHQLEAVQYGLNHNNWLLLDAPGLGKTLSMTTLAEELKIRENLEHCLIICGVNTLKTNWKREIQLHSNLSCRILGQRQKKNGTEYIGSMKDRLEDLKFPLEEFFIITNIETLRSDDIIKGILKGPNKFDMIVLDECHHVKNPQSQQSKGFLKLKDAKHKIGLTGTILTNSPLDAYVPLKWIGETTSTYTNFKYYFCNYTGQFNNILLGYRNIDILKDTLDGCSLRRTKDLLDLPEKNIIHEFVDMDSAQEVFYDNIKNGVKEQADKIDLKTANLLSMVGRLRQATACPSILTTEDIPSAKIDRAIDLTEQLVENGEKVVIFSTFKETLNQLSNKLSKYNPLLCTGDIKDEIINKNINEFQNGDAKIILATHQKMGTGITLTAASYMIFIDCPWTAADCQQCEDRIHRIGSKKPVFIYYLWTNNTVDLRVKQIVEDKQMVSDFIVDDKISPNMVNRLKEIIEDL